MIPDGSLDLDPRWTVEILRRFIRTELHRTGLRDLVLGLSGGIDSAVSVYLAAQAIEPSRIHACLMPYRASSEGSVADARAIVEDLGIDAETIDISPVVDGFEQVTDEPGRHRLGNVMARVRMTLLYDRSWKHHALVLGTSNKTELLLGYGTLHGDMSSALNPIGDLYKTQVRVLAEHLEVPESVRRKPPSADLWPDQTDEADLGFSYEEVDRLLGLLIDARTSRATAIEAGFSPDLVDRVTRTITRSQFKRSLPIIAKISTRSIGSDFRYPRDWMT